MNNKITIKPYAPNIGAIITGIDLSKKISNSELRIIKDAFHKYLVIFFQKQLEISPENHIKLGKCFAEQTEVNAPGIPNKIIFLFENKLEILIFTGSSLMS